MLNKQTIHIKNIIIKDKYKEKNLKTCMDNHSLSV